MKILRFFIKKWLKILLVSEKAVPLHPHFEKCTTFLGYGVMVTLQILVLPFLVRVRVPQQNESLSSTLSDSFVFLRASALDYSFTRRTS